MSRADDYESIDEVPGGVAVNLDAPDRVYTPEDQSRVVRLYCKLLGHYWTGHPYHEDGKTYPAASCDRCREVRIAEAPLSEVLA